MRSDPPILPSSTTAPFHPVDSKLEAKDIFWGAIKSMSFDDARKLLGGGDTAATDYLWTTTGDALTSAFRPVVSDSLKDVGVVQKYKQLQGAYQAIPFSSSLALRGHRAIRRLQGAGRPFSRARRRGAEDPQRSCRAGYRSPEEGLQQVAGERPRVPGPGLRVSDVINVRLPLVIRAYYCAASRQRLVNG